MPPSKERRELLSIQKRLWRRLQQEIDDSIDENPPNVEIYQEEFERDVRRYQAISSKAELVEAALASGTVYVGDYHSLPRAQKTLVKLVLGLVERRPNLVLCLEVVPIEHQAVLDEFMAGEITEDAFLDRIRYREKWVFPWPPYREIFQVARKHGLRVLGINSDPKAHEKDHLLERDFCAANVIVDEIAERPDDLFLVFDGDLHVARDHLPLIVDTVLQKRGLPARKRLIVHQNSEEIYWLLAKDRREQAVNVVKLADDAFCVFNASPFEKLNSYLNWVSERESLEPPLSYSSWNLDEEEDIEEQDLSAEYADQVLQILQTLTRFLEIKRDDLEGFALFTVNDLDFLDYLQQDGTFTEAELNDVKRQILSNESYFIPKGGIIYLSDFSVVNAAEEATHFLHSLCAGYQWDRPRSLEVDFYFRIVTEALGFFGSKVIAPTRECWTEADCVTFVELYRQRERDRVRRSQEEISGQKAPTPDDSGLFATDLETAVSRVEIRQSRKNTMRAARLVLHHKKIEREYLETGVWHSAGRALTQKAETHLLLTHMLGHMLGNKIYTGLVSGLIPKKIVRDLFHEPLDEKGVALEIYRQLVELTVQVTKGSSRGERL